MKSYSPWNHQKNIGFLIISGRIEVFIRSKIWRRSLSITEALKQELRNLKQITLVTPTAWSSLKAHTYPLSGINNQRNKLGIFDKIL